MGGGNRRQRRPGRHLQLQRTASPEGGMMIRTRIKEYRARYDMSQEELANKVGVRRETIGYLEKGKYNPSLVLAWRIARLFSVTIEDIFTIEEE